MTNLVKIAQIEPFPFTTDYCQESSNDFAFSCESFCHRGCRVVRFPADPSILFSPYPKQRVYILSLMFSPW